MPIDCYITKRQTNLYQTQKNSGKSVSPIDQREFFGFLGINFLMGYHKLPSWVDYWKTDQDLGIPFVSDVMSRNRFGHILWNLHVNDNAQIPQNNTDKLYKCAVNGRNRKSTKWWHRIFFGLLDRTLANSFIVYKRIEKENNDLLYSR